MCHKPAPRNPERVARFHSKSKGRDVEVAIDKLAQRSAVQGRPGGQQLGVVDTRDENNVSVLIYAGSKTADGPSRSANKSGVKLRGKPTSYRHEDTTSICFTFWANGVPRPK